MASHSFGQVIVHVLVATLVLIAPASAIAQQVGVKAGVNVASLTPEEDEDPDDSRRPGPVAGVWLRLPSTRRIALQIEGLFSEKGVTFRAPAIGLDRADVRLRYFEMPALAHVGVGAPGSAARAFVVGGAAPAFKLSAGTTAVSNGQEHIRDAADDFYSFDVGLVGGVGLAFGRAVVEGRYTHGLRHINTDDNGDEDRIKNRVFSVTVGLRLR